MNKKDRFDSFMQLADFRRQVREGRRKHEWQLSFAVWALLAAAAIALRGQSIEWLIVGGITTIALHTYWVAWNCYRAGSDSALMYNFFDQARHELGGIKPKPLTKTGKLEFLSHPPALFQIMVTGVMIIGVLIVATGIGQFKSQDRAAVGPKGAAEKTLHEKSN